MNANAVDIDKEAIHFDGAWRTRDELASTIRAMLDKGDYAISRHSAALETLSQAIAEVTTVSFRATSLLAKDLESAAQTEGRSVSALLRDAVARYLAMPRTAAESKPAASSAAPTQASGKEADVRPPEGRRPTHPEVAASTAEGTAESAAHPAPPPALQPAGGVMAGPGALRNAGVQDQALPSVVVTEPATAEEATHAVDLTPRVERGWFGS